MRFKCSLVLIGLLTIIYPLTSFSQSKIEERNAQDKKLIFRLTKEKKFDSIIEIFTEKSHKYDLSTPVLRKLVYANLMEEDFINALFFVEKLIEDAKSQKDTVLILDSYQFKTSALYYLRRLEDGIAVCRESAKYYRLQDSFNNEIRLVHMGLYLWELGDVQEAYDVYNSINIEIVQGSELEASYYNNFSNIYTGVNKTDSAIICSQKSLQLNKKHKFDDAILMDYSNLASAFIDLKDYETALKYIDSTKYIQSIDKTSWIYELIYENYYVAYLHLGEYDSAFVYLKRMKDLNQIRFKTKLDTEIEELKAATNREIRLVKKVELADKKLERNKRQRLWIIIAFLVLIIILGAIILLLRYRNLKNKHNVIIAEQKLLRSQMTPHFIFNTLSVIQGMILSNENKNASKYLSKFSKLMRLILENSRTKFVSLEAEIKAIEYYLELQNTRYNNKLQWTVSLENDFEADKIFIPPMLIQPFVENALEHGFKTSKENCVISVVFSKDHEKLNCIVKDNGVGVDSAQDSPRRDKKSLSTAITSERLEILSKELHVKASLIVRDRKLFGEQGTIVTLNIPYKFEA